MKKLIFIFILLISITWQVKVQAQTTCDQCKAKCKAQYAKDTVGCNGDDDCLLEARMKRNDCINNCPNSQTGSQCCHIVSINPNPTTGKFTVVYHCVGGSVRLNIYDYIGNRTFTQPETAIKGNNTYSVQLSNIHSGIYTAEVHHGDFRSKMSFIVQ
jgi:hypothetical protein